MFIIYQFTFGHVLTEVDIPIAILGAEIDEYCPPELVKQFEQVLITKPTV